MQRSAAPANLDLEDQLRKVFRVYAVDEQLSQQQWINMMEAAGILLGCGAPSNLQQTRTRLMLIFLAEAQGRGSSSHAPQDKIASSSREMTFDDFLSSLLACAAYETDQVLPDVEERRHERFRALVGRIVSIVADMPAIAAVPSLFTPTRSNQELVNPNAAVNSVFFFFSECIASIFAVYSFSGFTGGVRTATVPFSPPSWAAQEQGEDVQRDLLAAMENMSDCEDDTIDSPAIVHDNHPAKGGKGVSGSVNHIMPFDSYWAFVRDFGFLKQGLSSGVGFSARQLSQAFFAAHNTLEAKQSSAFLNCFQFASVLKQLASFFAEALDHRREQRHVTGAFLASDARTALALRAIMRHMWGSQLKTTASETKSSFLSPFASPSPAALRIEDSKLRTMLHRRFAQLWQAEGRPNYISILMAKSSSGPPASWIVAGCPQTAVDWSACLQKVAAGTGRKAQAKSPPRTKSKSPSVSLNSYTENKEHKSATSSTLSVLRDPRQAREGGTVGGTEAVSDNLRMLVDMALERQPATNPTWPFVSQLQAQETPLQHPDKLKITQRSPSGRKEKNGGEGVRDAFIEEVKMMVDKAKRAASASTQQQQGLPRAEGEPETSTSRITSPQNSAKLQPSTNNTGEESELSSLVEAVVAAVVHVIKEDKDTAAHEGVSASTALGGRQQDSRSLTDNELHRKEKAAIDAREGIRRELEQSEIERKRTEEQNREHERRSRELLLQQMMLFMREQQAQLLLLTTQQQQLISYPPVSPFESSSRLKVSTQRHSPLSSSLGSPEHSKNQHSDEDHERLELLGLAKQEESNLKFIDGHRIQQQEWQQLMISQEEQLKKLLSGSPLQQEGTEERESASQTYPSRISPSRTSRSSELEHDVVAMVRKHQDEVRRISEQQQAYLKVQEMQALKAQREVQGERERVLAKQAERLELQRRELAEREHVLLRPQSPNFQMSTMHQPSPRSLSSEVADEAREHELKIKQLRLQMQQQEEEIQRQHHEQQLLIQNQQEEFQLHQRQLKQQRLLQQQLLELQEKHFKQQQVELQLEQKKEQHKKEQQVKKLVSNHEPAPTEERQGSYDKGLIVKEDEVHDRQQNVLKISITAPEKTIADSKNDEREEVILSMCEGVCEVVENELMGDLIGIVASEGWSSQPEPKPDLAVELDTKSALSSWQNRGQRFKELNDAEVTEKRALSSRSQILKKEDFSMPSIQETQEPEISSKRNSGDMDVPQKPTRPSPLEISSPSSASSSSPVKLDLATFMRTISTLNAESANSAKRVSSSLLEFREEPPKSSEVSSNKIKLYTEALNACVEGHLVNLCIEGFFGKTKKKRIIRLNYSNMDMFSRIELHKTGSAPGPQSSLNALCVSVKFIQSLLHGSKNIRNRPNYKAMGNKLEQLIPNCLTIVSPADSDSESLDLVFETSHARNQWIQVLAGLRNKQFDEDWQIGYQSVYTRLSAINLGTEQQQANAAEAINDSDAGGEHEQQTQGEQKQQYLDENGHAEAGDNFERADEAPTPRVDKQDVDVASKKKTKDKKMKQKKSKQKKSPWSEIIADDGQPYFWNKETNETTWDSPPGWGELEPSDKTVYFSGTEDTTGKPGALKKVSSLIIP